MINKPGDLPFAVQGAFEAPDHEDLVVRNKIGAASACFVMQKSFGQKTDRRIFFATVNTQEEKT